MTSPRIAVVGHCAAGKSTVVELLVQQGYEAYAVAQEHSSVRELWSRQQPDLLVFLDVSLEALRTRKANPDWPAWIFENQNERLSHARNHANYVVDTDDEPVEDVVMEIIRFVERSARD